MSKRDAAADLATCDATGDTEWAYEFYSEALPYWLREVERLRGVAEANLAMSADLIAMEGTIKDLREANVFALSENARMKNALEEIEQVGHNPAHLACDLMDENPGMEDRLWALVNRLADMANQQVCIAHTSRKALYCNEGPQGSNWFDVMARLRHAILPEINADSTFFTIGQVRTLVAEIEKLESLVAEANSELAGVTDIYRRAYTAIGACDISNFLAKCEQAAGFEQLEHDLEGTIKELRHELDRSRNAHGKAELELARLRTTLASIEEYGTEEINAGIELRQEVARLRQEGARLHKIIADATGHSKDGDGVDLLCKALYGRPGQVPDWLGGSEARMLYDAVEEIEELRAEANALDRLRAWKDAAPGRWFNLENDLGCPDCLALGELPDEPHLPSRLTVVASDGEPHTEEDIATFAEMVDTALSRWSELYGEVNP